MGARVASRHGRGGGGKGGGARGVGNARAPWPCIMHVGKWRRDHDIAPGARPCRAPCRGQSRDMQNSQRVLLDLPRNGKGARDAKPRPTAKPHGRCARQRGTGARAGRAGSQAAPRADGAAARWGHRALPPSRTREEGVARGRGEGLPNRAPANGNWPIDASGGA